MADQRREPRKKLMAFTPIYALNPRVLLGYLADLTVRGAMVMGERSVEVDKHLNLAIDFPTELTWIVPKPFTMSARVVRCHQDESPRYFNIGLEFTNVELEQEAILKMIINRYQFQREIPI